MTFLELKTRVIEEHKNKRMEQGMTLYRVLQGLWKDFHPYFISSEKSLMGFKQQWCDKIRSGFWKRS